MHRQPIGCKIKYRCWHHTNKNNINTTITQTCNECINKFGAVDVRVMVSGKVMWKEMLSHQQKPFVDVPPIPVQPQQELELQVDFGKQADIGDNLIWCQPYFVLQN